LPPPLAGAAVSERLWLPVALMLSVEVAVDVNVPVALGVPLTTHVALFRLRPAGSEPEVTGTW